MSTPDHRQQAANPVSVNRLSAPLLDALLADAPQLRLGVDTFADGCTLVDAGIDQRGSLEAGRRIAEICLGGLGTVRIAPSGALRRWRWQVEVTTSQPLLACLASQYAGWSLEGDGEKPFRALGSGPARALACKEPLFEELRYRDTATRGCLVVESDRLPPAALAARIARDCGLQAEGLALVLTPTGSLAGVVQIAARVVEVAMHKAHALGFDIHAIVEGSGVTPLPPPIDDGLQAMGRTNDTILFAGDVHLHVDASDEDAEQLALQLPSSASRDYGRPFAEVFEGYGYDFFEVDPMLFSPARVAVTTLGSGRTFFAGSIDETLLEQSFGGVPPPS